MNTKSTISVRPATIDDLPDILNLERQSASASHWSEEQYRQSIRPTDQAFSRMVLVAEQVPNKNPAAILGFLVATHLSPEWELENMVVLSSVQRHGIGRALLEALLRRTRETLSDAIFLEVRESNLPARSLYESAGFVQTGRRKAYYTKPLEDAILYRRNLG